MNYKKLLCGVGTLTVCLMLTGCHNHEWQEATCTTPKTCLTGGETEGEALGHTWAEATCTEPKTWRMRRNRRRTVGAYFDRSKLSATCYL